MEDENEFLLVFDDGDFDRIGTTFNIDDWLAHTPRDILAKNFGVDKSVFDKLPEKNPYIINGTVSDGDVVEVPDGNVTANSTYVYRTFEHEPEKIRGNWRRIFPYRLN